MTDYYVMLDRMRDDPFNVSLACALIDDLMETQGVNKRQATRVVAEEIQLARAEALVRKHKWERITKDRIILSHAFKKLPPTACPGGVIIGIGRGTPERISGGEWEFVNPVK